MTKLINLLKEIIDIYSPDELSSKEIEYNIERESSKRFRVTLKYKDQYYVLTILPLLNPKRPSINFGSTDEKYENLNLDQLSQGLSGLVALTQIKLSQFMILQDTVLLNIMIRGLIENVNVLIVENLIIWYIIIQQVKMKLTQV